MAIDAAKHDGEVKVDLDMPVRGEMVPIQVTLSRSGLTVRRKGRRTCLAAPWWKVLRVLDVPGSAPAKFLADPEGFLAKE